MPRLVLLATPTYPAAAHKNNCQRSICPFCVCVFAYFVRYDKNLMLFIGEVFGSAFNPTEAPSHVELFLQLAPDSVLEDVRGWILVKSKKGPYWLELIVDDDDTFQALSGAGQLALDDQGRAKFQFRRKPCLSPNSSTTRPPKAGVVSAIFRNRIDPFTREEIDNLDSVLVLEFQEGSVALDQSSFETFVMNAEKAGKNFGELTLSQVEFEDGTCHDLALDWEIWVHQILPTSKQLRGSYTGLNVAERAQREKLQKLQKNFPYLWTQITYWVSDFGDGADSLERLNMPTADGTPPYMSSFYFSKEEAIMLGKLTCPSSVSLGDAMRAKSSTPTCAAHDMKPMLITALQLREGFDREGGFRKAKQEWVMKRKKERADEKRAVIQRGRVKVPNLGGFGIR